MKKSLMLILVAAIGLSACNNFKEAPNGTVYKIHKDGGKEKIKVGDYIKFNFIQSSDTDSLLRSTYDMGKPVVFQVSKKSYDGDMNDILTYFGEGDSATFKIDIDTMAKRSGQPRPADMKGKYMVFNVKIEKVFAKKAGEADSVFVKRASEFFQKDYMDEMLKLKNGEAAKLKAYVAEKGLKTTTSASGLQYVINNPGSGEKPVMGDTAVINYTVKGIIKKANGKENIFQTTDAKVGKEMDSPSPMAVYQPIPVVLGSGTMQGVTEGLMLVGKGGKVTLVIPSAMAYGEAGSPPVIPPYASLIFDFEIVSIKKGPGVTAPPAPVKAP